MKQPQFAGYTIKGKRTSNQDSYLSCRLSEDLFCFGIADGMGGVAGGKIASTIVVETAERFLRERVLRPVHEADLKSILSGMFTGCQEALKQRLLVSPELEGMGTTFSCLLLYKSAYVYGNIGDSRIYRASDGKLDQLTVDHSLIQEYRNQFGDPVPDHILRQSNVISKAIDGRGDPADLYPANQQYLHAGPGTAFLLCSDGLLLSKSENSQNTVFHNYMTGSGSVQEACQQLICWAYHAGSTDNITALLVYMPGFRYSRKRMKRWPYPPDEALPSNKRAAVKRGGHVKRWVALLGSLAAILALSVFAVVYLAQDESTPLQTPDPPAIPANQPAGKDVPPTVPSKTRFVHGFLNNPSSAPVTRNYLLEWELGEDQDQVGDIRITISDGKREWPIKRRHCTSAKLSEFGGLPTKTKLKVMLSASNKNKEPFNIEKSMLEITIEQ